jgi:hypothetical protein
MLLLLLLLLVAVVRVVKARTNKMLRLWNNQDEKRSMRDPPVLLLFTMVVGIVNEVIVDFGYGVEHSKISRYGKIFRKTCPN